MGAYRFLGVILLLHFSVALAGPIPIGRVNYPLKVDRGAEQPVQYQEDGKWKNDNLPNAFNNLFQVIGHGLDAQQNLVYYTLRVQTIQSDGSLKTEPRTYRIFKTAFEKLIPEDVRQDPRAASSQRVADVTVPSTNPRPILKHVEYVIPNPPTTVTVTGHERNPDRNFPLSNTNNLIFKVVGEADGKWVLEIKRIQNNGQYKRLSGNYRIDKQRLATLIPGPSRPRVSALYNLSMRLKQIAELTTAQILEKLCGITLERPQDPPAPPPPSGSEYFNEQILSCVFDQRRFSSSRTLARRNARLMGPLLTQKMKLAGVTSKPERAHFLAQILHETGGFRNFAEKTGRNCWQRMEQLAAPPTTEATFCQEYKKCADGDDSFFDNPSNGYTHHARYRGRGIMQLTYCSNYLGYFHSLSTRSARRPFGVYRRWANEFDRGINYRHCDPDHAKLTGKKKTKNWDALMTTYASNQKGVMSDPNILGVPCTNAQLGRTTGIDPVEFMADSALWYWRGACQRKVREGLRQSRHEALVQATECVNGKARNGFKDRKKYLDAVEKCI